VNAHFKRLSYLPASAQVQEDFDAKVCSDVSMIAKRPNSVAYRTVNVSLPGDFCGVGGLNCRVA
jgi:hypothetical protein